MAALETMPSPGSAGTRSDSYFSRFIWFPRLTAAGNVELPMSAGRGRSAKSGRHASARRSTTASVSPAGASQAGTAFWRPSASASRLRGQS